MYYAKKGEKNSPLTGGKRAPRQTRLPERARNRSARFFVNLSYQNCNPLSMGLFLLAHITWCNYGIKIGIDNSSSQI